jgi:beta-1,4-mannosyltransferase
MLPLAWLCARLRRARLVIDWHNHGFAMLGLRLGPQHIAVRAACVAEGFFGRRADGHLCVSDALARDLHERFGISGAAVVRDRPTRAFLSLDRAVARERLAGIAAALGLDLGVGPERRAVLVCPTGWGDDEDAEMLVEAIGRLAAADPARDRAPTRLAVLVTGRGPGRDAFAPRLAALDGEAVRVRTPWLESADYRALLAGADLGLCFHRSASGLDLPMKLADMRGAGLPVCALDFAPCLGEVFEADRHGWLFADAASCAERVRAALAGFPSSASLRSMREALRDSKEPDWSTEWARNAAPSLFVPSLPDLEHGQEPPVGRH